MEESAYQLQQPNNPVLFTSNKEVILPKLQTLDKYGKISKNNPQKHIIIMKKLLDIVESLEKTLSSEDINNDYILRNGEDFSSNDYTLSIILKMISRYCEPLDAISCAQLYLELEEIELSIKTEKNS